jgi:hypothetical protein
MRYHVTKYSFDQVIEADYFRLVHGHKESGSGFGYGTTVNDWQDVVFYRNGEEHPVAFVKEPYSVTEVTEEPEDV